MPSLLETVTALVKQGDNLETLAALLNIEPERASALVDLTTPVVIAGLANRAAEPGGVDIVIRLLDGVDAAIVEHPLLFVERGDVVIGEGLLHSVFADGRVAVTAELAEWAGAPVPVIGRLLSGILALAIGVLGRRRAVRGVDEAGVLTLLDAERSSLPAYRPLDAAGRDEGDPGPGTGSNRVPAMAGVAATVATGAAAGVANETVGASTRLGGSDAGFDDGTTDDPPGDSGAVDGQATTEVDTDGAPDRSTTEGEEPPGSEDRDGPDVLILVSGGLAAIVLLAWALSRFVGGVSADPNNPVGGATANVEEASAAGSAGRVDDEVTNVEDDPQPTGATGDTGATGPAGDSEAPATINEELSLDPITFEVRSATLTAEGLAVLDQAAAYLNADPEVTIEIAGHTDSDGDAADNMRLSQDRADAVKTYLESQGIDGSRMTSIGYGEDNPVASNATAAGKAKNRRIEFVIQ